MEKEDEENETNYHLPALKICLVGNSSVGKTACLLRYFDNRFSPSVISTVGIDFRMKTIVFKDTKFRIQCWDTAGQERYRSLIRCYFRGATGCLLIYDISDEHSFLSVQDWAMEVQQQSNLDPQIVLVGNKCDLENERVISYEDGRRLAEELGICFYETSAKLDKNIQDAFLKLVELIAQSEKGKKETKEGKECIKALNERVFLKDRWKTLDKNNCCTTTNVKDMSDSLYTASRRIIPWK